MKQEIRTKRLVLRPPQQADQEAFVRALNNREVSRWTSGIPHPYTKINFQQLVTHIKEKQGKTMASFAMEWQGQVIGGITLRGIQKGHKARLGYWLAQEYWGQGLMTEATKAMAKFGFEEFDLRRIEARVFARNKASQRVLEKCGFRFEGILKKEVFKEGKFVDMCVFAKVK